MCHVFYFFCLHEYLGLAWNKKEGLCSALSFVYSEKAFFSLNLTGM